MIISLTRATERVESAPSSWAATPETCGAAMLVPLMELVAVLLEPTHAPRMLSPGACAYARRGSVRQRVRPGGRLWTDMAGATRARGFEDLHVDARAVVGER